MGDLLNNTSAHDLNMKLRNAIKNGNPFSLKHIRTSLEKEQKRKEARKTVIFLLKREISRQERKDDYAGLEPGEFVFPPRAMPGPPLSASFPENTEMENLVFRTAHLTLLPIRLLSRMFSVWQIGDV